MEISRHSFIRMLVLIFTAFLTGMLTGGIVLGASFGALTGKDMHGILIFGMGTGVAVALVCLLFFFGGIFELSLRLLFNQHPEQSSLTDLLEDQKLVCRFVFSRALNSSIFFGLCLKKYIFWHVEKELRGSYKGRVISCHNQSEVSNMDWQYYKISAIPRAGLPAKWWNYYLPFGFSRAQSVQPDFYYDGERIVYNFIGEIKENMQASDYRVLLDRLDDVCTRIETGAIKLS